MSPILGGSPSRLPEHKRRSSRELLEETEEQARQSRGGLDADERLRELEVSHDSR